MSAKIGKENRLFAVVLGGLFIVAAIILANFLSFANVQETIINQIQETQKVETTRAAQEIESHIFQATDELDTLSKVAETSGLSPERCSSTTIHERISPAISTLAKANSNGEVIACSSPQISYLAGLNIQNKDYFAIPKQTRNPYITGIESIGSSQQLTITAPIYATYGSQESFQGVLITTININELFEDHIYPVLNTNGRKFFLTNLESNEIILTDEEQFNVSILARALPKEDRIISMKAKTDKLGEIILTSSDFVVGKEKWRLAFYTPIQSVAQDLNTFQKRNLYSLVFVLAIGVAVTLFLFSLYRSKENVTSQLQEVNVTLDKMGITLDEQGKPEAESSEEMKAKENLLPQEMEILEYINEQNQQNKLISFKDITKRCNITKPTTRARIATLTSKHLAEVEQRGRFKSLKLTEKGRRLIGNS
jgi:DNA-binding MarR family transcriptional regulator